MGTDPIFLCAEVTKHSLGNVMGWDYHASRSIVVENSKSVKDAEWSLRLDGLQIGLARASGGRLDIGGDGSDHRAADAWHRINDGEPFDFEVSNG